MDKRTLNLKLSRLTCCEILGILQTELPLWLSEAGTWKIHKRCKDFHSSDKVFKERHHDYKNEVKRRWRELKNSPFRSIDLRIFSQEYTLIGCF